MTDQTRATSGRLGAALYRRVDAQLTDTDALLASAYPGDDGRRQPVHTVYVPADSFTPELPAQWGSRALALVEDNGGLETVCALAGVAPDLVGDVAARVDAKLREAPIEDLRLDFEDGYGNRGDAIEDRDATNAATALAAAIAAGTAPVFAGLRFKCFEAPTRSRGIRTLDVFLATLLDQRGELPAGLVLTLPKVSTVAQVQAMASVCDELERLHGLAPHRLGFEIQVETPQLIVGADGRIPVAEAIHAVAGRVTALHYGTFDYSASLQIAAAYQSADHSAADFAKQVMQVAVAGTPVHLSDGSTNVIPVGSTEQVQAAWRLHAGLVRRALERGFYQGWDMHPGHLPTRFVATFAFYRASLPAATRRLSDYLAKTGSGVMDEPATVRALARYLERGFSCGAIDEQELTSLTGIGATDIAALARARSDTEGGLLASRR